MRNLLVLLAVSVLIFSCSEPIAPVRLSTNSVLYGDSIDISSPMTIKELEAKMASNSELTDVLVEGEIVGTCAAKGCWMTIDNESIAPMRVKFKDYAFFVPTEGAEGKKTIFKGKAAKVEVSVDEQLHYIDDMDASKEEKEKLKEKVTAPKTTLSFMADGVVIMD